MAVNHRDELRKIRTFPSLIRYLRDEMGWPVDTEDFEDLTFEYSPEELGLDEKVSANIQCIKRLRPLVPNQPWGIFFVKFEPKHLPVVALRRILSRVVVKKRASAEQAEQVAWSAEDLLFVSNYGEEEKRSISFAHFTQAEGSSELPKLKVLGWDNRDTALHLDDVADKLTINLSWPADDNDVEAWRNNWRSAFTVEHKEVIKTAKQLSIKLAELAQVVRDRIKSALEIESDDGPLTKLMEDFQKALIQDLNIDSFADMYAQTIAYGLLSVRITDPTKTTAEDLTQHIHTSPFLQELMASFIKAGGMQSKSGQASIDFDELGVSEVVELLDRANMEAVLRDFGDRNPQEDPVIHFYESFLTHYDAESRTRRGVFYTPRPVVSFIVRSVDELLQSEFGLEDGLADITTWGEMAELNPDINIPDGVDADQAFVQILDPATGTGTFIVEVIDLINKKMAAKWKAQGHGANKIKELWNEYVPKHLLPRLHGFELLMAPYAIAHLKVGLKLYETGYRFEKNERVRIYLTNALEPGVSEQQMQLDILPALAHEFIEVNSIKNKGSFTVLIGNPPYSGISSNMGEWICELIEDYKYVDGEHFKEKKHWLHDDYVKFIRLSHQIIQKNGFGVLGFVNNHGFIDNPTFRGMRWQLLNAFDYVYVLDLHGNTKKKEVCPDGSPDENVFDIQQGVSINVLVKCNKRKENGVLGKGFNYDLFGLREHKYRYLSDARIRGVQFDDVNYGSPYYFFAPKDHRNFESYNSGFQVSDLFPAFVTGVITARDRLVVDIDKDSLHKRMIYFSDTSIPDSAIRYDFFPGKTSGKYLPGETRGWKLKIARELVRGNEHKNIIRRFAYRPFDKRYIYYSSDMVDWGRENIMQHFIKGVNVGLAITKQGIANKWCNVFTTNNITDDSYVSNKTRERGYVFPLYLYEADNTILSTIGRPNRKPNLYMGIVCNIAGNLGLRFTSEEEYTDDTFSPVDILDYIYAILHSPSYREKYIEFLKVDFPKVPYLQDKHTFWSLVKLGGNLRQAHLLESPVVEDYITTYPVEGTNQVEKLKYENLKVKINKEQYFDNVPETAWEFYIGGYQPAQKWLKDRKGRVLEEDDINHYQKIIKALVETDRIMKEIDELTGEWI